MTDLSNFKPIEALIEGSTEKALKITVTTARGTMRSVWFPKSQVQIRGGIAWVPAWLIAKKDPEVGCIITVDRTIALAMSA